MEQSWGQTHQAPGPASDLRGYLAPYQRPRVEIVGCSMIDSHRNRQNGDVTCLGGGPRSCIGEASSLYRSPLSAGVCDRKAPQPPATRGSKTFWLNNGLEVCFSVTKTSKVSRMLSMSICDTGLSTVFISKTSHCLVRRTPVRLDSLTLTVLPVPHVDISTKDNDGSPLLQKMVRDPRSGARDVGIEASLECPSRISRSTREFQRPRNTAQQH